MELITITYKIAYKWEEREDYLHSEDKVASVDRNIGVVELNNMLTNEFKKELLQELNSQGIFIDNQELEIAISYTLW